MAEYRALQGLLGAGRDFREAIASYRPRPTDVIIAPFGKCGTTWLQQIFHCLRTRGDTDFDDISRVVPWIETAGIVGLDLEAPQPAEPRGFKSHLSFDLIPKGARYIVSLRDPKDAFVSSFRFVEGWWIEPGAVPMSQFAASWLSEKASRRGTYWTHLTSWWEQRHNPDVLLLSYEGMTRNPETTVRRVAEFSGLPLDDSLLALTLEHASRDYMLEHKSKFDDFLMRDAAERRHILPAGGDSSKVTTGGIGGHNHELPLEIADAMDATWSALIEPASGFADYAALERSIN